MRCVFCEADLPPLKQGAWAGVVIHLRCTSCSRTNKVLPVGAGGSRRYLLYGICGHPSCSELTPNPACSDHLWAMPVKSKLQMWKIDNESSRRAYVRAFFEDAPEPPKKKFLV